MYQVIYEVDNSRENEGILITYPERAFLHSDGSLKSISFQEYNDGLRDNAPSLYAFLTTQQAGCEYVNE